MVPPAPANRCSRCTYLAAAIARGERGALFAFDEELGLLFARAKGLGIDLEAMRDAKKLVVEQMDAAELSPGEFSHRVRGCVDAEDVSVVVIDSLNGYQAAMPEEQYLILHLHELLQYLNRRGAATFLAVAQHGMIGDMKQPIDVTYLADTVIMLRYFEALGRVRRAISVIKKRTGPTRTPSANSVSLAAASKSDRHSRISGRIARRSDLCRRQRAIAAGKRVRQSVSPRSERVLILAPRGRDAMVAKEILRDARLHADICLDIPELLGEIGRGADVAVMTEEATRKGDIRRLAAWVAAQRRGRTFPSSCYGAWRRTGAQSGGGAIGRRARQRYLPGAAVSPDHFGERGANRAARPRAAIRVPPA